MAKFDDLLQRLGRNPNFNGSVVFDDEWKQHFFDKLEQGQQSLVVDHLMSDQGIATIQMTHTMKIDDEVKTVVKAKASVPKNIAGTDGVLAAMKHLYCCHGKVTEDEMREIFARCFLSSRIYQENQTYHPSIDTQWKRVFALMQPETLPNEQERDSSLLLQPIMRGNGRGDQPFSELMYGLKDVVETESDLLNAAVLDQLINEGKALARTLNALNFPRQIMRREDIVPQGHKFSWSKPRIALGVHRFACFGAKRKSNIQPRSFINALKSPQHRTMLNMAQWIANYIAYQTKFGVHKDEVVLTPKHQQLTEGARAVFRAMTDDMSICTSPTDLLTLPVKVGNSITCLLEIIRTRRDGLPSGYYANTTGYQQLKKHWGFTRDETHQLFNNFLTKKSAIQKNARERLEEFDWGDEPPVGLNR